MRITTLFGKTLREAPADADSDSHRLLLRAGLVQQTAAGIYSYLPLGLRVLRKVEQIVREEFDRANGQEVLMPALSPADLWEESGRRSEYGATLMTVTDRRERELVLGPTHEEIIVDLFRRNVQSYKELPKLLYQIQTKFRDEARPRMGLLRGREFSMADLYSFHADEADLDRAYDDMHAAYMRVFERCAIPVVTVHADSGAIGGKESLEFMLLSDIGEDEALFCNGCDYAANAEKAELKKPPARQDDVLPMEDVATPGQKTIEEVAAFLGVETIQTLKAVFYMAKVRTDEGPVETPVFAAIRGDLPVNEIKLSNALKAIELRLMTDDEVRHHGLVAGSASPVGLTGVKVVADDSVTNSPNLVAGANREGYHARNVNYGRDWQADVVTDVALARAGDTCPFCGGTFESKRVVETGHIFKLGTRYTQLMGANFLDAEGVSKPAIMGCYGIGVSRLLQCIVEVHHDERGISWPQNVTPYDIHVVGLGLDRPEIASRAELLYNELRAAGLEALYDDRLDVSAGVKFNDADLLGLPVRVTVSPRSLEKGAVEVKRRDASEVELVPFEEAVARLTSPR